MDDHRSRKKHPGSPVRGFALQLHTLLSILTLFVAVLLLLTCLCMVRPVRAFEWVPPEEEIQKYRRSWNPLSNGPNLMPSVDLQPKGQWLVRPFVFSQLTEKRFGNDLTTNREAAKTHLYQSTLLLSAIYGMTDHLEANMTLSTVSHWTRDTTRSGDPDRAAGGLGDVTLAVKYRPIVQDPEGWRPSITTGSIIVVPTGYWAGTERPPGGFLPLGRLPATRFGSPTFTQSLLVRKNLRPFRVSGGVFYSHHFPGQEQGETVYPPDMVNTRLVFEHLLDDTRGFGYNLEFVGLHGLPFRADGHTVNLKPTSFTVLAVGPTLQYRFSEHVVGGMGVLFTVAGQNGNDGIYPHFSLYWYWSKTGKVMMR